MAYRLYRRDPVKRGSWYFAVKCKGCEELIYVLDDNAEGKLPNRFVGDAELSIPCNRCTRDVLYAASELRSVQSSEDLAGARPPRVRISKASRKPLWKAYPNAKATFGVGYVEDRPAAAAIVGRVITSWADVEVSTARLLAELMGTDTPAVAAVFSSLRSSRVQQDALSAAASSVLSSPDMELFSAYMKRRSELEKERNDLAHGCFGVSVAIPDHVVWVSQADYVEFVSDSVDRAAFRRRQFVYELGTLERIAQAIVEFHTQLGFFIGYLRARRDGAHGASFRSKRYAQLCDQPHIRQALDRVRIARTPDQDAP